MSTTYPTKKKGYTTAATCPPHIAWHRDKWTQQLYSNPCQPPSDFNPRNMLFIFSTPQQTLNAIVINIEKGQTTAHSNQRPLHLTPSPICNRNPIFQTNIHDLLLLYLCKSGDIPTSIYSECNVLCVNRWSKVDVSLLYGPPRANSTHPVCTFLQHPFQNNNQTQGISIV